MKDPELERLFARYVDRGDAAALGQVFDAVAPELLTVAGHLARDSAQAEDFVQATFLAAIEGARRHDRGRPLVPWLVGILTRQARYAQRSDGRRPAPERLNWRPSREPREASEGKELAGALREALSALPRLYRDVLEAHLHEGLAPREIAARTGRPAGTVRVQLHRGFDLLRQALPAGFALGAAATLTPTRGLAAVKSEVLAAAKVESGGVLALLGGASLVALLGLAAGAALLVGGVWFGLTRFGNDDEEPTSARVEPAAALERRAQTGDTPEELRSSATPQAAEPGRREASGQADETRPDEAAEKDTQVIMDAPRVRWLVDARVTGPDVVDGDPAVVSVRLAGTSSQVQATVDADGRAQLDVSNLVEGQAAYPPLLTISAEHAAFVPASAPLDVSSSFASGPAERVVRANTLRMQRVFTRVEGSILSSAWPVTVALFEMVGGEPRGGPIDELNITSAAFSLRVARRGAFLVVAEHAELRPVSQVLDVQTPAHMPIEELHLERGRELAGEVVLPEDFSAAGGFVVAVPHALLDARRTKRRRPDDEFAWRELAWDGERVLRRESSTEITADGSFALPGLERVEYALAVRDLPGLVELPSPRVEPTWEVIGAQVDLVRLVPPIGLVHIEVRDARGPVPDAVVEFGRYGNSNVRAVNSDGKVSLLGRAGERLELVVRASAHGEVERTLTLPSAGMSFRSLILLPDQGATGSGARARLVWRGESPAPFVLSVSEVLPNGRTGAAQIAARMQDGSSYELAGIGPGAHTFEVRAVIDETGFAPLTVSGTVPDEGLLTLDLTPPPGGRFSLNILDASGTVEVERRAEGRWRRVESDPWSGKRVRSGALMFTSAFLADGAHTIRVTAGRRAWTGRIRIGEDDRNPVVTVQLRTPEER